MRKGLAWALGVMLGLVVALGVLWWTSLLFPVGGRGVSDSPTGKPPGEIPC